MSKQIYKDKFYTHFDKKNTILTMSKVFKILIGLVGTVFIRLSTFKWIAANTQMI